MIELTLNEFASVLPLVGAIKQQVLPSAICQGINPGRVFVDRADAPRVALLWTPVGYYFLAGEPAQAGGLTEISHTLTEIFIPASQASGETGFILIPSTAAWKEHLPTLLPGREAIEIYRRPFVFDCLRPGGVCRAGGLASAHPGRLAPPTHGCGAGRAGWRAGELGFGG